MTGRDEPAFPCCDPTGKTYSGMALRDYFAAKAMQGMVINAPRSFEKTTGIAEVAYRIADEMLEARK